MRLLLLRYIPANDPKKPLHISTRHLDMDLRIQSTVSRQDKYRAEIDGLRAIAILPVVFFHCRFALFPGGYVGVDVFL